MELPTIVYIGGWGRSGSTLLCRALGELPGWRSVGEVRQAWDFGVLRNAPCSCGLPFRSCPFWSEVFDKAFGGMDEALARSMVHRGARLHTWQMLALPRSRLTHVLRDRMSGYVEALDRLYRAMAEVSGATVLVDSSKMPPYALALDEMTSDRVRMVHLVRDPRACTYSWARRRKQQPFGQMKSIGPARNGLQWVQRNEAIRALWARDPQRYRLVRYEDFVADPMRTVAAVAAMTGCEEPDLAFLAGGCVRLSDTHLAAGNPNRFETGAVALREDNTWRTGLPARDRATTGLIAAPWLARYGYSSA